MLQKVVNDYWKEHKTDTDVVDQKILYLRNLKYKNQPTITSALSRISTGRHELVQHPEPPQDINQSNQRNTELTQTYPVEIVFSPVQLLIN
jgi:hypothetical protein